jgi:O-acetyl-ADP-ribose deacetylase (regulator of RNase III)
VARLEAALGVLADFNTDASANPTAGLSAASVEDIPADLFEAYYQAVQKAAQDGASTLALTTIADGQFGLAAEDTADIAVAAVLEALADFSSVQQVTLIAPTQAELDVYLACIDGIFD